MNIRLVAIISVCFIMLVQIILAEKVILTDGTEEQGELSYRNGALTLDTGANQLLLQKHRIARIDERGDTYADYRIRYEACDKNSIDHLFELARWCESRFLLPEMIALYEKIVEIDPQNHDARNALGFVFDNNKWRREPADEYRIKEMQLRCGDKAGYEELALWCANNAVTEGLKDCSFYLLRLDPFSQSAIKWAKSFLERDARPLARIPLAGALVANIGEGSSSTAFNLFSLQLASSAGELIGEPVFSPCDGKVLYVSAAYEDRKKDDKPLPERENFIVIKSSGKLVTMFGIAANSAMVGTGADVRAGQLLAKVGNPVGGVPTLIVRVTNDDHFSIPVMFDKCVIRVDGKDEQKSNYRPVKGDALKASEQSE